MSASGAAAPLTVVCDKPCKYVQVKTGKTVYYNSTYLRLVKTKRRRATSPELLEYLERQARGDTPKTISDDMRIAENAYKRKLIAFAVAHLTELRPLLRAE